MVTTDWQHSRFRHHPGAVTISASSIGHSILSIQIIYVVVNTSQPTAPPGSGQFQHRRMTSIPALVTTLAHSPIVLGMGNNWHKPIKNSWSAISHQSMSHQSFVLTCTYCTCAVHMLTHFTTLCLWRLHSRCLPTFDIWWLTTSGSPTNLYLSISTVTCNCAIMEAWLPFMT